jgi:hypothetical protein
MNEALQKRIADAVNAATLVMIRETTSGAYISKASLVNFLVQAFKEADADGTFDPGKFREACYKNWPKD